MIDKKYNICIMLILYIVRMESSSAEIVVRASEQLAEALKSASTDERIAYLRGEFEDEFPEDWVDILTKEAVTLIDTTIQLGTRDHALRVHNLLLSGIPYKTDSVIIWDALLRLDNHFDLESEIRAEDALERMEEYESDHESTFPETF